MSRTIIIMMASMKLFAKQAHSVFAAQTPVHQSSSISIPKMIPPSLPTSEQTRLRTNEPSALLPLDPSSSPSPSTFLLPSASASHSTTNICHSHSHPLVFYGNGPHDCLLPECGGHCESDFDCSFGLFCYRPSEYSDNAVPGCDTPPFKDISYCVSKQYAPSKSPSHASSEFAEPANSMELRSLSVPTGWYQLGYDIDG